VWAMQQDVRCLFSVSSTLHSWRPLRSRSTFDGLREIYPRR
jgi:hypothetical protein